MEESIVAIHHLLQGTTTTTTTRTSGSDEDKFIVMDVCAGKGLFSFLLSYLAGHYHDHDHHTNTNIERIIMLEKATINWFHIDEANKTAEMEGRPKIIIWKQTNLHDYDAVLDRILDLPHPVAMSGIHLCKQLGPSFCGLVNGLGGKCIYACLTPCCMPRAVTAQKNHKTKKFTLVVQLEESMEERQSRKDYMERRERVKYKPVGGPCFYCHDDKHDLRECSLLPTLPKNEQISIRQAWHAATVPCWNCLEYGHFKTDCPKAVDADADADSSNSKSSSSHHSQQPPSLTLDVSNVLQEGKPYSAYCHLLAGSFQNAKHVKEVRVIETELENLGKHQEGNWNSERKSIFIVVK